MKPDTLAFVLQQLQVELPSLIGRETWNTLVPTFQEKVKQLQEKSNHVAQLQAAADLVDLLSPYEPVRIRLQAMLGRINLYQHVLSQLAFLLKQTTVDQSIIYQLETAASSPASDMQTRMISLKGSGEKGKSIKWENFSFDFGESTELAAGILAACHDIFDKSDSSYWLMAAGVLLIIRGLQKALTVEISEQEAGVFLGIVKATQNERWVDAAAILKHTNLERQKVHLALLTEQQISHSLYQLTQLNTIQHIPGNRETWRVIEKFEINK